ncbi:MAG: rod shape-determining protein MreC [bacterium]|nr:rod shape-determining protein MreC [bacterium]
MNFHLQRKKPRSEYVRALVGVCVFALAIFVLQWLAPNIFSPISAGIAKPLFYARDSALSAAASIGAFFSSRDALTNEIAALDDELARVKSENEFLRSVSAASPEAREIPSAEGTLVAVVLSRPRWSAYDTLIIGTGYDDGVHIGMPVSASGFVIGEVAEVNGNTSLVSLYSTAGKKTIAQISGKFPVELIGSGGGTFETRIAKDVPVSVGDGAFAASISPKLFAVVDAITNASEGAVKIFFRLPVNIFELRAVDVGM